MYPIVNRTPMNEQNSAQRFAQIAVKIRSSVHNYEGYIRLLAAMRFVKSRKRGEIVVFEDIRFVIACKTSKMIAKWR